MTSLSVNDVQVVYPKLTDQQYSLKHMVFSVGNRKVTNKSSLYLALADVSFEVKAGQRLGIIGANGAGKSTLLRVLAGIYPPTKGSVVTKGKITSLLDLAVGMDLDMTGWENIRVRLLLLGIADEELIHCTRLAGEFSELGERLQMPIRTYSTGMFVRLSFSVCAVVDPEILLLDEFLSAGDLGFVTKAQHKMNELIEKGSLVIVASHALHEVRRVCTDCLWLENGRMKMIGSAEEVVTAYETSAS